jgi:PKD repeat protein
MSIKREFLYNEEKFLPLQLLRTNYGIAEVNPTFSLLDENISSVEIILPIDSSNIVMVMDNRSTNNEIIDVQSSPLGSSNVSIAVKENDNLSIYVVSKEYEDGFILADQTVKERGERYVVTFGTQAIDLSGPLAMVKSLGRTITDSSEWYNYEGSYIGPLIWESPSGDGTGDDSALPIFALFRVEGFGLDNQAVGELPFTVTFIDMTSRVEVSRWVWDFGDGGSSTEQHPTHTYTQAGIYSVTLSVVGVDGSRSAITLPNHMVVTDPNVVGPPNADFSSNFTSGFAPLGVQFTNLSTGNPTEWQWDYGDITKPANDIISPSHLYTSDGSFTVSLTVTNQYGSDTMTKIDYITVGDGVPNDVTYQQLDTSEIPVWFDINVPWFSVEAIETRDAGTTRSNSSGVYTPNEVWNMLIDQGILTEDRDHWISADHSDLDLDGPDVIERTDRVRRYTTTTVSDWQKLVDYINENLGLLYMQDVTDTDVGENEDPITPVNENPLFPLAHEATLQNIRFLRDLISSLDANIWETMSSSSALVLASLLDVKKELINNPQRNTILNITNSTVIDGDIEVLWRPVGTGLTKNLLDWTQLEGSITDIKEDVKLLTLNQDQFKTSGKYMVLVRPRRTVANISSVDVRTGSVVVKDLLNSVRSDNYYYGYNAQLYTPAGAVSGEQKIIIQSNWSASDAYLKLSPINDNTYALEPDSKIELWANHFIPVLIEVDVVEHNALTLSYSLYGKKELNTDTGLCKIYDHNGNLYTELSFGKVSNALTGNAIIEYRTPADDTDDY